MNAPKHPILMRALRVQQASRERRGASDLAALIATPHDLAADMTLPAGVNLYVRFDDPQVGVIDVLVVRGKTYQVEDPQGLVQYPIGYFEKGSVLELAPGVAYFELFAGLPLGDRRQIAFGGA